MNLPAAIQDACRALRLDAAGFVSLPLSPDLPKRLEHAGPVPFAPEDIKRRVSPEALLPGCQGAVVILFPYSTGQNETGNISLYARAKDYHRIIHRYLAALIDTFHTLDPSASFYPLADTSPLVDRWLAYEAGLGFFGKNHLLIHPKYGSWFTIGAILTTWTLPKASPMGCCCGECRQCINACIGGALSDHGFNPWRCKSFITQKKEDLSAEEIKILKRSPLIFGCDACQSCCPFNKNAAPSPLPSLYTDRVTSLSKDDLSLSHRQFEKKYRDYAFAWRGKKVLLRNFTLLTSSHDPTPSFSKNGKER
ncbi:MAG: QueG-associated DUF1730 domain-containing protein [Dialister sp.]|nr:QueG-associated DUF1730 domain-containing protein [Dialister sp.]